MTRSSIIAAGIFFILALLTIITFALWRSGAWLPPVAVRGVGRVAGLMSTSAALEVELPIPLHYQEHSLSCEVAALKMALDYFGAGVPESELIKHLPFDPAPKSNGVWGNPNRGFVGNIDGRMLVDGYGVYWEPIAALGARYRRTAVLRGTSAANLAQHIAAGRPVIIWGYFGRGQPHTWRTREGQIIQAVNGEHTRLVTGFSGPSDKPTHFALLDPIFGRLVWPTETLLRNWDALGRHAVVVY